MAVHRLAGFVKATCLIRFQRQFVYHHSKNHPCHHIANVIGDKQRTLDKGKAHPMQAARQYAPERFIMLVSGQSMRSFGLLSANVLRSEIPINQFIQHCGDIVRAPVLVIQVVGVLPHIDGQ
jgi:hypothetical protein